MCSMLLVLFCIHVNHLCTLYLYSFLAVVYRGPHGRLAFFSLNVLPSENKDYYYYYYFIIINVHQCLDITVFYLISALYMTVFCCFFQNCVPSVDPDHNEAGQS